MDERSNKRWICDCVDFRPNMDILSGYIVLQALRRGNQGYQGKFFVFCPWCGKKLIEEKQKSLNKISKKKIK